MRRLYLFAEGQTEQTFASVVLKPHLQRRDVPVGDNPHCARKRKNDRFTGVAAGIVR